MPWRSLVNNIIYFKCAALQNVYKGKWHELHGSRGMRLKLYARSHAHWQNAATKAAFEDALVVTNLSPSGGQSAKINIYEQEVLLQNFSLSFACMVAGTERRRGCQLYLFGTPGEMKPNIFFPAPLFMHFLLFICLSCLPLCVHVAHVLNHFNPF